jgi:hypothetical protein
MFWVKLLDRLKLSRRIRRDLESVIDNDLSIRLTWKSLNKMKGLGYRFVEVFDGKNIVGFNVFKGVHSLGFIKWNLGDCFDDVLIFTFNRNVVR